MANRLNKGDIAYIVDNGHFLREVKVLRVTRDLFTICYLDTGATIRVRKSRLFFTEKEALETIPPSARPTKKTHWDYYLNH